MKKVVLLILAFPAIAKANSGFTLQENVSKLFERSYLKVSVFSSRSSQKSDYRSLKTTGLDEGGGVSERTVLPNQSFVSAFGMIQPFEKHQLLFGALQSVDSEERRQVPTPFGSKFTLPGRISVARYRYLLSEEFSLSAGAVHVDTFGYSDPFLGIGYRVAREGGWIHRAEWKLSAPVNRTSRADGLLTRGVLRADTLLRHGFFVTSGGLSHSRPFYRDSSRLDRPSGLSSKGSTVVGRNSVMAAPKISELDLLLMQRENSRSSAHIGTGFQASKKWRLSTSANVAYLTTFQRGHLWVTGFKPINAIFTDKNLEIGAGLGLLSDIQKYRRPSLPKDWNVGLNVSYSLGVSPHSI